MQNLAGNKECDEVIAQELERARIDAVRGERRRNEVAASITGKLGPFTFVRAWYYWMVRGPVPLAIAKEIQADPVGADIRVAGMSGGDAPERWLSTVTVKGRREQCVTSYDIDTEVGLRLFADVIRKHGLDK
jgi:hypothetical protein